MLHDMGKLKIALDILRKPGALTLRELEVVRRHTVLGSEMRFSSFSTTPRGRKLPARVLGLAHPRCAALGATYAIAHALDSQSSVGGVAIPVRGSLGPLQSADDPVRRAAFGSALRST